MDFLKKLRVDYKFFFYFYVIMNLTLIENV